MTKSSNQHKCSFCEEVIPEGVSYWSLNLMNETEIGNTIEVNQAHALISWCDKCENEIVYRDRIRIGGEQFHVVNGRMVKSSRGL